MVETGPSDISSHHSADSAASTRPPMGDVEGKVAFITGGDSGIGLGIARAFVDAGMKIVMTYRSQAHLEEAMELLKDGGKRVHAIRVDVANRTELAAAAEETLRVFGKVHVLVNNAGVGPMVPLSSATFDDWDWCMSVNVGGVFNGICTFLPHIRAHGEGGQIVSTSSMLGGIIVGPFWGVYSTSKFAVTGMMEALRSELADTRIGVSVLCPAVVSTPLMSALEAGRRVLHGIRNNDLYILSHSEYEQAIRDRNEALLASMPSNSTEQSQVRRAIAQLGRNRIYTNESRRKAGARGGAV
jgi:NAD(P)-dependent dehydrogenase (short-subunit alcohol dehydrogenase family)